MAFGKFKVVQVAAASRNRVIGVKGKLPWHLPEDLKFFKEKTLGHVCIMGRKTFDSIGRKGLPRRLNIVVSRSAGADTENLRFAQSLEAAMEMAAAEIQNSAGGPNPWGSEIMIIGGGEIYRASLSWTDRIYLTEVEVDIDGDTFFPDLPPNEFKVVHRDHRPGEPAYTFVTLQR
jgi:dihydrofolate reductase